MNVNKLATLLLLLTLPAPADGTFAIFASIILWFTGFFDNICDTALNFVPRSAGCECSSGLTSVIFGLVVTGARLDIDDCLVQGNLAGDPSLSAQCRGNFEAEGPLISVFSQEFEGAVFGQLDCSVLGNDIVDRFTLTVRGNVDLTLTRPDLNLVSCEGTVRNNGISVGPCTCNLLGANGLPCPGGAEISFNCPAIALEQTCVDLYAIA